MHRDRKWLPHALRVLGLGVALAVAVVTPAMGGPLAATALWLWALMATARTSPRGALSMEVLYLLLLGVFHLGLVAPVALGFTPETFPNWLDSPFIPTSLRLFSFAVIALALGAHFAPRARANTPAIFPVRRHLFVGGLVVAVVGIVMLWVGIFQFGLLRAAYGEFWGRAMTEDVRLFGFGLMLLPIGILVAAFGSSVGQLRVVAAVYGAAVGPLFFAGFRGHVIVHGIALISIWLRKEPHVARRLAGFGALAALVLVPAVKLARNLDKTLSAAISEARPLEFLMEMGGSLRPLVATTELVEPGVEPLWLGRSYAQAAGRIVPNIALEQTGGPREESLPPSAWITREADPWVYDRGGGLGFSGVAEPYLNFGWVGVFTFFAALGYLLRRWDDILTRGTYGAAVLAATFGFVLWTVRNDMMGVARAALLSTLVVTGLRWFARFHHSLARTTSEYPESMQHGE